MVVGAAAATVGVIVASVVLTLQFRGSAPRSQAAFMIDVGPGDVRDLTVSPRGGEFVVVTDSGSIQFRGVSDGDVRLRLETPVNDEIHLAYSGDGALLAAGGDDGVHVWDVATGVEKARIPRTGSDVHAVALSPDGARALVVDDSHVWLVDLAKPNTLRQVRAGMFTGPQHVSFGPDGTWAAGWAPYRNGPLTLFDPRTGDDVRTIGRSVTTASFTPDGRTVLVHERNGVDELARYDTATGDPIGPPVHHDPSGSPPISIRPDGARIAAADDSVGVHVWDTSDGRELDEPRKVSDPPLALPVTALSYTTDGKSLLIAYFDRVERHDVP